MSGNSSLGADLDTSSRPRANSSDIAEERGVSLYPSTKKNEGKILRPQYKDILKGKIWKRRQLDMLTLYHRSCQFLEFDKSFPTTF